VKEKIIVWLDRLLELSLLGILFSLPFSKSLVEIFFGVALGAWIIKKVLLYAGKRPWFKIFIPAKTELNLPIAFLVFFSFISALMSTSLSLSLESFFSKFIELILIYFMVAETFCDEKRIKRVLLFLTASVVLICIDGMYQNFTGVDFLRGFQTRGTGIEASFGNSNDFGTWLIVMIPLFFGLSFFWKRDWIKFQDKYDWVSGWVKPVLCFLSGLLFICVILVSSRGVWIAVLLTLIFLGVIKSKKILLGVVILLLVVPFIVPDSTRERAVELVRPIEGKTNEVQFRMKLWTEAVEIIKDYPVFGSGLNTYTEVVQEYTPEGERGIYPHNCYLQMAAETGILGLGAFLWMILTLFISVLRSLKRIRGELYSAFLVSLLAGLFGFLLHSFVDTALYSLQLSSLMWFVTGLIVATKKLATNE